MKKGKIVIFSGPSGVGKGTVRDLFFNEEEFKLTFSVSATTRSPRPGEINGREYHFLTPHEFGELVENHGFIEHAEFAGNLYGTLSSEVESKLENGQNVFLEIEPQGALQVLASGRDNLVSIFIGPPSIEELHDRLKGRGTETEEVIDKRLSVAQHEIDLGHNHYKHFVINDDLEKCGEEIREILRKELK